MNLIPEENSPPAAPKQAELYENLRRIGELEDKKQAIQKEIGELTEELRAALDHLDTGSLLHQMLSAALSPPKPAAPPNAAKTTTRKKSRKKVARKKTKKSTRK